MAATISVKIPDSERLSEVQYLDLDLNLDLECFGTYAELVKGPIADFLHRTFPDESFAEYFEESFPGVSAEESTELPAEAKLILDEGISVEMEIDNQCEHRSVKFRLKISALLQARTPRNMKIMECDHSLIFAYLLNKHRHELARAFLQSFQIHLSTKLGSKDLVNIPPGWKLSSLFPAEPFPIDGTPPNETFR